LNKEKEANMRERDFGKDRMESGGGGRRSTKMMEGEGRGGGCAKLNQGACIVFVGIVLWCVLIFLVSGAWRVG
jgi:hypothetical protein